MTSKKVTITKPEDIELHARILDYMAAELELKEMRAKARLRREARRLERKRVRELDYIR